MHAVVARSTIQDFEQARKFLREEAIPRLSQMPGFVSGHPPAARRIGKSTDAAVASRRDSLATKGGMMISKIIASVVVVLALGAGVAYAATQLASTDGTQVCVNQTNGLMRASSTCRDGEYAMTIGGGSDTAVTASGKVTIGLSGESDPITLPLTGLVVTGKCELQNAPPPASPTASLAKLVISSPTGSMVGIAGGASAVQTMVGGPLTTVVTASYYVGTTNFNKGSAIVTSNGATASIQYGAWADDYTKTCTFLWQATEVPN